MKSANMQRRMERRRRANDLPAPQHATPVDEPMASPSNPFASWPTEALEDVLSSLAKYSEDKGVLDSIQALAEERRRRPDPPAENAAPKAASFLSNEETSDVLEGYLAEIDAAHSKTDPIPVEGLPKTVSPSKLAAELSAAKAAKLAAELAVRLKGLFLDAKPITQVNEARAVREAVDSIFIASQKLGEAEKLLAKQAKQEEATEAAQEAALKPKKSAADKKDDKKKKTVIVSEHEPGKDCPQCRDKVVHEHKKKASDPLTQVREAFQAVSNHQGGDWGAHGDSTALLKKALTICNHLYDSHTFPEGSDEQELLWEATRALRTVDEFPSESDDPTDDEDMSRAFVALEDLENVLRSKSGGKQASEDEDPDDDGGGGKQANAPEASSNTFSPLLGNLVVAASTKTAARATRKDRAEFVRLLSEHAPKAQTQELNEHAVSTIAEDLMRLGSNYARVQEWKAVERDLLPMGEERDAQDKKWNDKEADISARITSLCAQLGVAPVFGTDPQGKTVKVSCPDRFTNDHNREGICVPTS